MTENKETKKVVKKLEVTAKIAEPIKVPITVKAPKAVKPEAKKEVNEPKTVQKVVTHEGAEVTAILSENGSAKHCRLSNGTTAWVPKSSF